MLLKICSFERVLLYIYIYILYEITTKKNVNVYKIKTKTRKLYQNKLQLCLKKMLKNIQDDVVY